MISGADEEGPVTANSLSDEALLRLLRAVLEPPGQRNFEKRTTTPHQPKLASLARWAPVSGYEQVVSEVVRGVEAVGAGIMVFGGLGAFLVFASTALQAEKAQGSYDALRRNLGRCILLGLEVLIVADIVRTIIVDPTLESVAVLGVIVVIRILLSFSLEVEIDGLWPWRRWQLDRSDAPTRREATPESPTVDDVATASRQGLPWQPAQNWVGK